MSMFNVFSMIDSYGALDKWVGTLNSQAKGSFRTGYKAERVTFQSDGTDSTKRVGANGVQNVAEGSLYYKQYTDFSDGNIQASDNDLHAAIGGNGWFLVTDGQGQFYYSRDGEFVKDPSGLLVNQAGLAAVDQAMAANLPAASFQFNQPAMTATDVNNATTGWRKYTGGGPVWLPYVAGTNYDEGGNYKEQEVYIKRSFYLNAPPSGNVLSMTADDLGYAVINGTTLTTTPSSGVQTWSDNANLTMNIDGFLKQGWNTILVKAVEFLGGEGVNFAGTTLGGVAVGNTGWSTTMVSGNPYADAVNPNISRGGTGIPFGSPLPLLTPDAGLIDRALGNVDDLVLVAGPVDKTEMQPTKYGNTIFSWSKRPTVLQMEIPGNGGTDKLVHSSLESANVDLKVLAPELAMAQQMYSNLQTILQLKKSQFDQMISIVK